MRCRMCLTCARGNWQGAKRHQRGRPVKYLGDPDAPGLDPEQRRQLLRRISNRESARRVRKRHQEEVQRLHVKVCACKARDRLRCQPCSPSVPLQTQPGSRTSAGAGRFLACLQCNRHLSRIASLSSTSATSRCAAPATDSLVANLCTILAQHPSQFSGSMSIGRWAECVFPRSHQIALEDRGCL